MTSKTAFTWYLTSTVITLIRERSHLLPGLSRISLNSAGDFESDAAMIDVRKHHETVS